MRDVVAADALEIHGLMPEPAEEWRRLLRFVGLNDEDRRAMSRTVEALLRRAPEMVVGTYNYLQSVPETAAVLGWESGFDEAHLEERRRFFTVWLARVLGMDTSDEFAEYLFRAGKYHAGHGPRRIHVPPAYVTTSIGMMGAAFARCMGEAGLPGEVVAPAMAGWTKYLSVQLHLMDLGYRVAADFHRGDFPVSFALYGRLRLSAGQRLTAHAHEGDTLEALLRKFFNYVPELRADCLRPVWHSHEKDNASWVELYQTYEPAPGGWRFLHNGRNAAYAEGFAAPVHPDDTISIFPPGR
ncbi:protoglobin domain-containing protein [Promineifilum sp.]|uniref:protoglobin domain-containing protein n=1 Tax=Promineifilum sp. TaxID=2664178 RepID=UPI0035AFC38A